MNFEVGETVTTDKLQVHSVTYKVDFKSNRHGKTFFAATTLKFVTVHMSARLNWETFVLPQQSLLNNVLYFSQTLAEDWKNITKELAARAVLSFLS